MRTKNGKQKRAFCVLEAILGYDLEFYKMKNGRLNITKMSKISGLSRSFLSRELFKRGLI
ncbi:hypothetical protein APU49_08475 [Campylobacter jejuni]|nr:hypothetical protein [Campylobacter jejuni]